jgi:hypothetical protein
MQRRATLPGGRSESLERVRLVPRRKYAEAPRGHDADHHEGDDAEGERRSSRISRGLHPARVPSRAMPLRPPTPSGATFSRDRRYRYRLWRSWGDPALPCVFVGLNPSTADESNDDPTIRKCVGFAKHWGFGGVDVVNLFAFRSTEPAALSVVKDPVGRNNAYHVTLALRDAKRIVWAWGSHSPRIRRLVLPESTSLCTMERTCEAGTLGITKDGSPRHPLMLAYTTPFGSDG